MEQEIERLRPAFYIGAVLVAVLAVSTQTEWIAMPGLLAAACLACAPWIIEHLATIITTWEAARLVAKQTVRVIRFIITWSDWALEAVCIGIWWAFDSYPPAWLFGKQSRHVARRNGTPRQKSAMPVAEKLRGMVPAPDENKKLRREWSARFARFNARFAQAPPILVRSVKPIVGGVRVTIETAPDRKGDRESIAPMLGVDAFRNGWTALIPPGERVYGVEPIKHRNREGIDINVYAEDPFKARHGAAMLHPDLTLPAPHLPSPQALLTPVTIGVDAYGQDVSLRIGGGESFLIYGPPRQGKSSIMVNALRQLLVRPGFTVTLIDLEGGDNVSDFNRLAGACRAFHRLADAPISEVAACIDEWRDWVRARPGNGAATKTENHLLLIDGVGGLSKIEPGKKAINPAGWMSVVTAKRETGKFGGQFGGINQYANATGIPDFARNAMRDGQNLVVGNLFEPNDAKQALNIRPSDVDMEHLSGRGRGLIRTGEGRIVRFVTFSPGNTESPKAAAFVAFDELAKRSQVTPNSPGTTTPNSPPTHPQPPPPSDPQVGGQTTLDPLDGASLMVSPPDPQLQTINDDTTRAIYRMVLAAGEIDQATIAQRLGLSAEWIRQRARPLINDNMLDTELVGGSRRIYRTPQPKGAQ